MPVSRDPEVFWKQFESCLLDAQVSADKVKWYLGWARQFARRMQAVPLRQHSAGEVAAFLQNLEQSPKVQPWQVAQAGEALRLFYQRYLGCAWAGDWVGWTPADAVDAQGSGIRADEGGLSESEKGALAGVLERLRAEIRLRQYSRRTEKSYLDWVRRFVLFHQGRELEAMGGAEVKTYLNSAGTVYLTPLSINTTAPNKFGKS